MAIIQNKPCIPPTCREREPFPFPFGAPPKVLGSADQLLKMLQSVQIKKQVRKFSEHDKDTNALSLICKTLSQIAASMLDTRRLKRMPENTRKNLDSEALSFLALSHSFLLKLSKFGVKHG